MVGQAPSSSSESRSDSPSRVRNESSPRFNALVKANKLITSSSGEELARLLPKEISGDPKLYAESFEHAREAFPPDSLVSRDGVARVSETMRAFDVVPAGMKFEPESVYDNRFVLKALGR